AFYDFNPNSLFDPADLQGQPRTVSMVQKVPETYGGPRTAVWDLKVGLPSQGGAQASFDMTGQSQASFTGGKQLALGSGVTYYSRTRASNGFTHVDEPPNMFAP